MKWWHKDQPAEGEPAAVQSPGDASAVPADSTKATVPTGGLTGTPEAGASTDVSSTAAGAEIPAGADQCSARQCTLHNGTHCSFVDRHNRRCPTAWCPEHRKILNGKVYCPTHAELMSAIANGTEDSFIPDMSNQIPLRLIRVVNGLDIQIGTLVANVASARGETVLLDPVHFNLIGLKRTRVWERSWKTASVTGLSLRITARIEEAHPDVLEILVNSASILQVKILSDELDEASEEYKAMFPAIVTAIQKAVARWQTENEPDAAPASSSSLPPGTVV